MEKQQDEIFLPVEGNGKKNLVQSAKDFMAGALSPLKGKDLSQMVENINGLVTTSQSGVEEALSKINDIDFSTLNQAVKDLSDVVNPLADFVKKLSFGGIR